MHYDTLAEELIHITQKPNGQYAQNMANRPGQADLKAIVRDTPKQNSYACAFETLDESRNSRGHMTKIYIFRDASFIRETCHAHGTRLHFVHEAVEEAEARRTLELETEGFSFGAEVRQEFDIQVDRVRQSRSIASVRNLRLDDYYANSPEKLQMEQISRAEREAAANMSNQDIWHSELDDSCLEPKDDQPRIDPFIGGSSLSELLEKRLMLGGLRQEVEQRTAGAPPHGERFAAREASVHDSSAREFDMFESDYEPDPFGRG